MDLSIIQSKIHEIRGRKVMLDYDLAERYGIETRVLKQSVRRNIARFEGDDFMFKLTNQEFSNLRSQIVTSNRGGIRYQPFAFTELGVAMLSSVLNSETAIEMNRNIMRAFVLLRQYTLGYAELNHKLEMFMSETNTKFSDVYQVLTELLTKKQLEEKPINPIGFKSSKT